MTTTTFFFGNKNVLYVSVTTGSKHS